MTDRIIIDLDNTIAGPKRESYEDCEADIAVVERLKEYSSAGYEITIFTARNMRTYDGNIGKINVFTLPQILDWLRNNDIPFDEVLVGKPWCGPNGFYVDDRAIRPSEFVSLTEKQLHTVLSGPMSGNE